MTDSGKIDIVERLRGQSSVTSAHLYNPALFIEAADVIERLQKERETWDRRVAYDELKAREFENRATQQGQIDRLTAEVEQLRKGFGVMQEALIVISAKSLDGSWAPQQVKICADSALKEAVYGQRRREVLNRIAT